MKSEFLPTDNRGSAAAATTTTAAVSTRRAKPVGGKKKNKKKCIAMAKTIGTSAWSADREWILRFPRASVRVDVHTRFTRVCPDRRVSKREHVKRARRPIIARQTATLPKTAVLFTRCTHLTANTKLIIVPVCEC